MQTKKKASAKASPFNSRSHYTTAPSFVVAVVAWAYAMTYLQAENVTQRQQSAPVAVMQEAASHE